ncbi:MAG: hypothetical protein ACQGVC_07260 [Myxococcota bacterium]
MSGLQRAGVWATALLAVAAALRLFLFAVSEPHNAYDDHLEAIAWYATHGSRPAADACWQCYQPPAYYALAAGVLRAAAAASGDNVAAWHGVQLLSVLFSVATLVLVWRVLTLAGVGGTLPRVCALAVAAFLPREVYTSVFISNDGMLSFAVGLSTWIFLEIQTRKDPAGTPWLAALLASVVLAAWTKQHGLIAAVLPLAVVVQERGRVGGGGVALLGVAALLLVALPLHSLATTGHLLVSNQHYFDWPSVQRPGSLAAASFLDFRIVSLFREPTLHASTIDSFWTQLFAKLWFDYDPKFLVDTAATRRLAAGWYAVGLLLGAVWALGFGVALRRWARSPLLALLVLQVAFLGVPLLQSLRFPYYSSMKATFFLPALPVSAVLLGFGFERLGRRPALRAVGPVLCVAVALLFAWECVLVQEQIRDAMLASLRGGKLWPYPPGWGTR